MANIFNKWFNKKEEKSESETSDIQSKVDEIIVKEQVEEIKLQEEIELQEEIMEEEILEDNTINFAPIINDEDDKGETQETFQDEVVQGQIDIEEQFDFVEKPQNFFSKLRAGLTKTREGIKEKVDGVLANFRKIDEELFEELEEMLIMSDIGVQTTRNIIENIKLKVKLKNITDSLEIKTLLKEEMNNIFKDSNLEINMQTIPSVIVVVGVNGVGKTTSIGKIANSLKNEGKKVIIAAADTFRAAAVDQLEIWAKRVNVDIIKHQEGADPGAVVYDAIYAAKARKTDVLICDTAGRLHNKKNLMDELGKIQRIIDRELPECSKEVLLVLDATTGQNAVQQAKTFSETINVSGIILTKLDGTAKGGIIITIKSELNIPVKFIGVGEGLDDLQKFNSQDFVNALFD